jgi:hypothetical protein
LWAKGKTNGDSYLRALKAGWRMVRRLSNDGASARISVDVVLEGLLKRRNLLKRHNIKTKNTIKG